MKTTLLAASLCLATSLAIAQKQALLITSATPTTSDTQVSNRLALLGFTVTRITDSASQTSDANGKNLVVISSSVGSGNISTKFTTVAVPLIDWEWAVFDELGMDSNNAGGVNLTSQTQIRITDPTHPLAAGLPAGLVTVLSAPGDVASLAVPYPGAKVVATGASSSNAVIFAYEKGDPLHPARTTNAPARRVAIFLANDTFRNATDAGQALFDAAVSWATLSARILFIVDSILGDGTANQANDREVVSRLRNQGHVVTLADDQDANLGTFFDNKDLIIISSSVGSGNQPLNSLAISDLRTRNVPILNYEPGLDDELLLETSAAFLNPGNQVNLNITAAGQSHPLGAGNCAGSLRVATATATYSMGSLPATYGAEAIVIAEAADAPSAGAPAIFVYEAGSHLADNTTVTPSRRLSFFYNASTAAGGYNAAGQGLLDAAVKWALSAPDTTSPVNLLNRVADVTANESAPVRFTVKIVGAAPWYFQWFRNGMEIGGANCATYSIPAVSTADNGATFFAVVSNSFSVVTSRVATLTVIVDTNPPTMVSAFGAGLPPTSFDLVYSEPVTVNDAQDTFNYTLNNGANILSAALDADGKTVHFTCEPITNGTVLSLLSAVHDLAFNPNALNPGDPGSSIAIVTADGSVRRHRYNNIGGVLVSDLTGHPNFPSLPDVVDFPTSLEDPSPSEDTAANNNFGVHLQGYLTAPLSGSYNFFISADDQGLLFLSTDDNPAHRRLIAAEPVWNNPREWVAPNSLARRQASTAGTPNFFPLANPIQPQNRSEFMVGPISLAAGQRYYIEAFMKEGGGGNNLGVTWQRPGDPTPANGALPIPGLYLSRYNVPVSVPPDQPADVTTLDFRQVTFTVSPGGSPLLSFQWYENNMPIGGANGRSFTTPLLTTADSGKTYYAVVMNDFSAATSRVATLTVNADMVPPVLVAASALNSTSIGLCFDEALDAATAQNTAYYTVNGGAVNVTGAVLRYDLNTVALTLDGPVANGFSVSVNNVTDLSTRNAIAPNTMASGNVAGLIPTDIGTIGDPAAAGSSFTCRDGEFELIAGGSDVWGNSDHGHFAYRQIAGNFDKSVKIGRMDSTDPSAKGGLMVRESLDAASRNLHAIVMPPLVSPFSPVIGRNIYETGTRTTTGGTTTGWGIAGGANGNLPANHPNSWIRLRRIGTIWKAYVSSNGLDWVQNGQAEQLYPDSVFVLLEATAHNNDGRTNRVLFKNLADTVLPGTSVAITQQPQDTSIDANHVASFSVAATASGVANSEIGYQWQKSDGAGGFTNINAIGANGTSLSVFVTLADNAAQYRAVASVPGASAVSSAATLTVTNDTTPPRIVSASRGFDPSTVTVVFDEFVELGSAEDTFSYSISGGISVFPAVLGSDGRTVRLTTTSPLAADGFYLLTVNGVKDLSLNGTVNAQALIRVLTGPVQAIGGQLVIEAENFDTNTPASNGKMWQFLSTPGGNGTFSGLGYMQALPESGGVADNPTAFLVPGASPRLDYRVNLPVTGTWRVWLRGNDFVGGANSCHVGIDGTAPNPNNFRIGNTGGATGWGDGNWKWTRDANDSTTTFADVRITTPGLHTFNVWMREDSVIVDKILLTMDTANLFPVNTVIGPDESGRADQTPQARVNIVFSGGNVTLSWNVPSEISRLQQAALVRGTWSDVMGANPNGTVLPANAMQMFYRVVIP